MQYKLPRKSFILLSLAALALVAGYFYYDNNSPPCSSPAPVHVAVDQSKSADSLEEKALPPTDKADKSANSTGKSDVESRENPVEVEQQIPPVIQAAAPATQTPPVKPAENQVVQAGTGTKVSRAPNTYINDSYPMLSKDKGTFGQFHYRDTYGGRIEIDPQWVEANIVTIVLPGINRKVQVHKNAADNFITAFNYINNGTAVVNGREVPLLSLVKSMDGTFVTRHVNWSPTRGISNHSWGIAIDINAADHYRYVNPGKEPADPNLILWEKAFKPAGFSWGNSYSDSMHYELLK
ncbi:MAG: M15 family metallopeptidase [Syntrophomonadaceae bacterium]|nr:M15 family metallopeptidase [Syntrophomonadaceae bacterium]